jgi:hypothetical protein
MDSFFAILFAGGYRFEGTINHYACDGIMTFFGTPVATASWCRLPDARENLWFTRPARRRFPAWGRTRDRSGYAASQHPWAGTTGAG